MFEYLRKLIAGESVLQKNAQGEPADYRLAVSVAILLWEMARVDGETDSAEYVNLVRTLNKEFHFYHDEAESTLRAVEYMHDHYSQLENALSDIRTQFSRDQREHLCSLLWQVAQSDHRIDPDEQAFYRYIRRHLGL